MNIGVPLYGRSFKLPYGQSDTTIGCHAAGAGAAGMYTREAGFKSYYEVNSIVDYNIKISIATILISSAFLTHFPIHIILTVTVSFVSFLECSSTDSGGRITFLDWDIPIYESFIVLINTLSNIVINEMVCHNETQTMEEN